MDLTITHGSGVVGESSLSKAKWIVNAKALSGLEIAFIIHWFMDFLNYLDRLDICI